MAVAYKLKSPYRFNYMGYKIVQNFNAKRIYLAL